MLKPILNLKLRFASVVIFLWAALSLPLPPHIAAAQCSPDNAHLPARVLWSKLSFRGKAFSGSVSVDVQLTFLPSDRAQNVLIASPKGVPVSSESSTVGQIVVHRIIDPAFGSEITERDKVLFDPIQASALGRVRIRRGKDDFLKTYRFTNLGVYRIQKEPSNKKEVQLSPDKWTKVGESFYRHDLKRLGCSVASERSILLYLACTAPFSKSQQPLSVCVFGKRQLHRVDLSANGLQSLEVNYLEKKQDTQVAKQGKVDALKLTLQTQPLDTDLDDVENFSFLGLRKDIAIFIDPTSKLPLQISGKLPKLGTMHLKLSEVELGGIADLPEQSLSQ
jgi:hypothetical protein